MTRVNFGISPKNLSDEHLLSEHREIKRICKIFKKRIANGNIENIPEKFCLGKGHVLFFLNKGKMTLKRYKEIRKECLMRKFNVSDFSNSWDIYKDNKKYFLEGRESYDEEKSILRERLILKIKLSKKKYWHYKRERVDKDFIISLLLK
jgi:hypothetical protein